MTIIMYQKDIIIIINKQGLVLGKEAVFVIKKGIVWKIKSVIIKNGINKSKKYIKEKREK